MNQLTLPVSIQKNPEPKRWIAPRYLVVLAGVALGIVSAYVFKEREVLVSIVRSVFIASQVERVTELYTDYDSLPLVLNQSGTSFSFMVVNSEGVDMTYHYAVTALENGKEKTIKQGVIELPNGESKKTKVLYRFTAQSATVSVTLQENNQTIHFILPRRP